MSNDFSDGGTRSEYIRCLHESVLSIQKLSKLTDTELESVLKSDKQHAYDLFMAMGHFIDKTCGNLNKLYEKTTELSISMPPPITKDRKLDVEYDHIYNNQVYHVKSSYGPDLVIHNNLNNLNTSIEVKTSVVKADKGYKSNWMFTHAFSVELGNENAILKNLVEKYSGIVILSSICDGKEINRFTLSGLLVSAIIAKKYIEKYPLKRKVLCSSTPIVGIGSDDPVYSSKTRSFTVNFGSLRCENHKTYHRIEKIQEYDSILKSRNGSVIYGTMQCFQELEWSDLLKNTEHCKEDKHT